MYRLYQDNLNPRPDDEGDNRAVEPLPAPFYGDEYAENDIPLQVNVPQAVGDEPSALGDGSAMAFQREFEEVWLQQLVADALQNGWRPLPPAPVEEDDNDEDQVTEWGINSIPPVIHDALVNEPDIPVQARNNTRNHAIDARLSFETSNNETTVHGNSSANSSEADNVQSLPQNPGEIQGGVPFAPSENGVLDDDTGTAPPPPTRRVIPEDDPGPSLSQVARPLALPARAGNDEWQTLPNCLTENRAMYISAGIIKPKKDTYLGIELRGNRDGTIEIERIADDGYLFVSGTPLRVGDRITGIKTSKATYACGHVGGMRKNDVLRIFKKSVGRMTIVAENPTGDPERIECMTSKPHPQFGTGIFFLSGSPGSKMLQIHSVPANGLFANSLLHRGAQVISINGVDCSELDAAVATDIVKSAPRYVTIVAHTTRMRSVYNSLDPGAHLRSVPEAVEERRTSFGIFRRRGNNPCSVDC